MSTEPFQTELVQSAIELAQLIKADRRLLETSLYDQGAELINIYYDSNYDHRFQNMRELKTEILTNCIEDVSAGGGRLLLATLGIVYQTDKLCPFIEMLGTTPTGNIVYSIHLKQKVSFQHWREIEHATDQARNGENFELTQAEINAAIYRLTVELSEVL